MAYILSLLVVITSTLVILSSSYKSDNSQLIFETNLVKSMFYKVDSSVESYLKDGHDLTLINFGVLENGDYLLINSIVIGNGITSTMKFKGNEDIIWHLIPNPSNTKSYKLLIDFEKNTILNLKSIFAESYFGENFCERLLFGDFDTNVNTYQSSDFTNINGTNKDSKFVCTVYK